MLVAALKISVSQGKMSLSNNQGKLTLLSLPEEILENILLYLDYDAASRQRRVCKSFDTACKRILNQGLSKVDSYHSRIMKTVKSQLPRRESERRTHHLARHIDILASIETRLSLLKMTYTKYIDITACCFIPGKVLDEMLRVLRYTDDHVSGARIPPRAHELLQELRDISSMAMEHFDERIAADLRKKYQPFQIKRSMTAPHPSHHWQPVASTSSTPPGRASPSNGGGSIGGIRCQLISLQANVLSKGTDIMTAQKDVLDCKLKSVQHTKKCRELEKRVADVESTLNTRDQLIQEQNAKIENQQGQIAELNKKIIDYDQKFVDLVAEVNYVIASGDRKMSVSRVDSSILASASVVSGETCTKALKQQSNIKKAGMKRELEENDRVAGAAKSVVKRRKSNEETSQSIAKNTVEEKSCNVRQTRSRNLPLPDKKLKRTKK